MKKYDSMNKRNYFYWYSRKFQISSLLLFLLVFSVSLEAKKPVKTKSFPIGVCQKAENSQLVKNIGFAYIECGVGDLLVPTQPEEVFRNKLEIIRKGGAEIYSCNSFIPGTMHCFGPDAVPDRIIDFATTALQRAKEAGVRIIVFGSGTSRKIPDGMDKQIARKQFVDLLKKLGPVAKKNGVTIAIEPLNHNETNFINTVTEACEIAREADQKNIRVLADFYHMNVEGESAESIVSAGKLLVHCHVAETVKRAAPGVSKESFLPFFKALQKINYNGRISIECSWTDFVKQAPEALRTLRYQQDTLNNTLL